MGSVFLVFFVCLHPVSGVPNVASVSGLSFRFSLTFILTLKVPDVLQKQMKLKFQDP
jgi:hypothetical protein